MGSKHDCACTRLHALLAATAALVVDEEDSVSKVIPGKDAMILDQDLELRVRGAVDLKAFMIPLDLAAAGLDGFGVSNFLHFAGELFDVDADVCRWWVSRC